MNTEEILEPATVTLIVYRGIGLQPPKSKRKDSKKAKWKILFCHGQEKKMSTMEVVEPNGSPVWDTTATFAVGNSFEPLVLMLHYRDTPVGQVIVPFNQVPDRAQQEPPAERFGELEGVKKNPEPSGGVYFCCWVDTYRPAQPHGGNKPPGLLKRLSLSRNKLSVSSASLAREPPHADATADSRKASVPTVKKLKRRLFGGGKSKADRADGGGGGGVSKAISMGNLSSPANSPHQFTVDLSQPSSAAPSAAASPLPQQRHPFARPQSLHNLVLGDADADVAIETVERLDPPQQQQLSRSRSAACLFSGPTYPSVDTDRPLPEVTELQPDRAPALGGQRVAVRGVALALSASDLIGASLAGVPCRAVAFVSPEEVVLTAGMAPSDGAVGPVELVTVSAGCVRSAALFTYASAAGASRAAGGQLMPGGGVARSPSLCQLPIGGGGGGGGSGFHGNNVEVRHAKSNSLEGSSPQLQPPPSSLSQQPRPAPAKPSSSSSSQSPPTAGGNIKKSRSVWDLRLGRRGSDASNSSQQAAAAAAASSSSKLRKRDSGKGTLSKKQLAQEVELLRGQLEAARDERAHLASALMEAERLALDSEQRAMETEERARLDGEAYEDRLLELTNFIDSLQSRIIESGHVELLEKMPPRQPRC